MQPQHRPPGFAAAPQMAASGPPALLELVDFKWLMVGEGHRVDLDRLQADPAYIRGCLALAAGSTSFTLRQAAERLSGRARALGWLAP